MTEEEWLTPGDLQRHVDLMGEQNHDRKLRLFGVACCRPLEQWVYDGVMIEALLRAERFADGELKASTMRTWRQKLDRAEEARWKAVRKNVNATSPQRTTQGVRELTGSSVGNAPFGMTAASNRV
jgi:hypothetical protein